MRNEDALIDHVCSFAIASLAHYNGFQSNSLTHCAQFLQLQSRWGKIHTQISELKERRGRYRVCAIEKKQVKRKK